MADEKCDVTGVTVGREYKPLAANMPRDDADNLAAQYSSTANYSAVLVKIARTGLIVATFVNGKRQPA